MNLKEWLASIDFVCDDERPVVRFTHDSRKLDSQTWWLAVKGSQHHALDFYQKTDCAGILYETPYLSPPQGAMGIADLGAKVGILADAFYDHPSQKMQIIGVTGTDGKSSLVYFLAQAMNAAMIGTIGYGRLENLQTASHTTPDPIRVHQLLAQFASEGVKTVAMEVSSHALSQHRVAGVAFDIAVFSNLSRDHLDYHSSLEDYFLCKAQLFAQNIQHAVINLDDEHGRRLISEGRIHPQAKVWGVSSKGYRDLPCDASLLAKNIHLSTQGIAFDLCYQGECVRITTHILARFNVDNLLNVSACLLASGIAFHQLPAILQGLHGVPGRVEKITLPNQALAIIDYAHTEGAIESVLESLRAHTQGKLWILFGCGGDRDKGKRPLMGKIAEEKADCVVLTDDNPRTESPDVIIQEIMQGMAHPERAIVIQPREQAIVRTLAQLNAGDILLIAGKGHENYQMIGDKVLPFSDRAVVEAFIHEH